MLEWIAYLLGWFYYGGLDEDESEELDESEEEEDEGRS